MASRTTVDACVNTVFCFFSHSHFHLSVHSFSSVCVCVCVRVKTERCPCWRCLAFHFLNSQQNPGEPHWYFRAGLLPTCESPVLFQPLVFSAHSLTCQYIWWSDSLWVGVCVGVCVCVWVRWIYNLYSIWFVSGKSAQASQRNSLTRGVKLSLRSEVSEELVPVEVEQEASFLCHVLLSRLPPPPALSLSLLFFLHFLYFFCFHFRLLCFPPPSFSRTAPHSTLGNNGSLTTFAETLWTRWLCNINQKITQNVSFPSFSFSPGNAQVFWYPRPCYRHIYYASHAAYDLAPVQSALTWVIWKWIKV